jgi:alpha-1,3-glucan synthase
MLSQLSKTIKMALKSTEEERSLLRARSAVQRFPVVEWRQRTEDFHKRSIGASRGVAGHNAWRPSDGDTDGHRPIADTDDWNPVMQADPSQPEWDRNSYAESVRHHDSPRIVTPMTPGSPGNWSQDTLTPANGPGDAFLAPVRPNPDGSRMSVASDMSDDYFAHPRGEGPYDSTPPTPNYGNFLDRANRQIAKDQKHVPDPFLDPGLAPPSRPFGAHSRVSSVESISSIVDEKQNSPLNKAIASVCRFCQSPYAFS